MLAIERSEIEKMIDLDIESIRQLYMTWDKGDCSLIGLIRILLIQEIEKEIKNRGEFYDGQYDDFLNFIRYEYYA